MDEDDWLKRMDGGMFALLFGAAVMAWMFTIGVVSAVVGVAVVAARGGEPDQDTLYEVLYQPEILGPLTLLQMAGTVGIVFAFTHLRGGGRKSRWAMRKPVAVVVVGAVVAGLSVGPVAGYVAQAVEQLLGPAGLVSAAHLEEMGRSLVEGPLLWRIPLILAVLIGAPLVEELVFRGLLWSSLEERMSPTKVWIVTSLGFAAYHMDPLHSVAVLATAFLLGWLRMSTGSIWPSVVAHFANNVNGVLWIFVFGPEDETVVPLSLAVGCVVVTFVACMTLVAGRGDPTRSG
jgi:membrane protease YdiL (CAAX protease family)